MAVFKVRYISQSGRPHVHCRLFVASQSNMTHAYCGDFTVAQDEFEPLQQAMSGVAFQEDNPSSA